MAIRLIGKDVEVGGGYTMKDFPFAYIPPNPFGDNSVAALKLVSVEEKYDCSYCFDHVRMNPASALIVV